MNNKASADSFNGDSRNGNNFLIQEEKSLSIIDLLDNLYFYRWHFIVSFAVITCIAAFYAILSTPIYVADALSKNFLITAV